MALTTVPVELANLDGAVTVNESSADADFRVESNGSANMLFVDGGNDRVGINTNSPLVKFTVAGGAEGNPATSGTTQANASGRFFYGGASLDIGHYASGTAWILNSAPSDLSTNRDIALQPNGGKVGIGVSSPIAKLSLPAQASGDSGIARIAIESAVDDNDFMISQFEDSSGTYTLIGQNLALNSSGNDTILDGGHRTAAIRLDARGSGSIQFLTGGTNASAEAMRIDSSGFVSIGNTVATTLNTANGYSDLAIGKGSNDNAGMTIYSGTNHGGAISFADGTSGDTTYRGLFQYSHGDDSLNWWTAGTQRLNLNSTNLFPQTNDAMDLGGTSNKWDDIYATNGTIQTSDKNEKNTIVDSDLGLSFIKELKPVSYKFNNKTRTHYGLIAQDVKETLDSISKSTENFAGYIEAEVEVDENDDPLNGEGAKWKKTGEKTYGLRYGEFIAPLIKAVQEQQTLIETLEAKVKALEEA